MATAQEQVVSSVWCDPQQHDLADHTGAWLSLQIEPQAWEGQGERQPPGLHLEFLLEWKPSMHLSESNNGSKTNKGAPPKSLMCCLSHFPPQGLEN